MSAIHVYFLAIPIVERDHMTIPIQLHVSVTICFRHFTVKSVNLILITLCMQILLFPNNLKKILREIG